MPFFMKVKKARGLPAEGFAMMAGGYVARAARPDELFARRRPNAALWWLAWLPLPIAITALLSVSLTRRWAAAATQACLVALALFLATHVSQEIAP